MVKPFLPEVPEKLAKFGTTPIEYILGSSGYKAFQKLLEKASSPPN
jgi:hypothetical protein